MAFGYEYLMVHLPEVCPNSFLLFVHSPAGSTKLRDYSGGRERQLPIYVPVAEVLARTEAGRTRFYYSPHRTGGSGVGYWSQVTQELNRKWLAGGSADNRHVEAVRLPPAESSRNRAVRGSRRQLQDYVNENPAALSQAVLSALPSRLTDLGATIRWVAPLARDDYREYRDAEFLAAIGITDANKSLADFWPSMGPCWDALGVISDPLGRLKPGAILVEAKSHIPEIYGNGCQAGNPSREKIERALTETKAWLNAGGNFDWLGPLYQYANRVTHLYFLTKKLAPPTPAWLVNLYFLDDPIGPTTEAQWRTEIQNVKNALGITGPVPNAIDVFLPAIAGTAEDAGGVRSGGPEADCDSAPSVLTHHERRPVMQGFRAWSQRWMELAGYPGPTLGNPEERIERLLGLWKEPIPGLWHRSAADTPGRLLDGRRYTRGDEAFPRNGEHKIEYEILCEYFDEITCFGDSKLIDGVNAFPLVRDSEGGRSGNVEADLLLLIRGPQGYRVLAAEVKHAANHTWYAAVENLRQLKLIRSCEDACQLFRRRNPGLHLPDDPPITGVVISPPAFYRSAGQKVNSVAPARKLLRALRSESGADVRLLVWDAPRRSLTELD